MWTLIGSLAVCGVAYSLFEEWKKRYPEKWAEIEREALEKQAKDFVRAYDHATRRVPDSEWILMTRKEKSDVFAAREGLEANFSALPMEARKIVVEKFGIGPDFPSKSKGQFSR